MSNRSYDAIVVGARCAGSPTAMLLARKGHRVLLVDKATFPSDTMSTHHVHPPGVAALERWGLLERLESTGCPPVETYSFDFGPLTIAGSPQPIEGIARGYCPRRTVLDQLLVDAAVEAGAELREAFTVDEILADDGTVTGIRGHAKGGATVTERARVVIGADGKHSLVAKAVKPEQYHERRSHLAMYYAYWSGLPTAGFDTTIRAEHRRGWAAVSTHDDLTVVPFGWPVEEFKQNRTDIEGNFFATVDLAPEFAERVRAARRGRSSSAPPSCRDTFASRSVRAGRCWATPATTRIRSRRWASTTHFATPSSSPMPSMTRSRSGAPTRPG